MTSSRTRSHSAIQQFTAQTTDVLGRPLTLRRGVTVPNRIVKAAMEEQLARPDGNPDERLARLYRRWDEGGAGMMITGHIMVDRHAVAQPADVVLDRQSDLAAFRTWSRAARSGSIWAQLNHPGRVVLRDTGSMALAPSAVPVSVGALSRLFPTPTPMTEADIRAVIGQFASSARLAEDAGFAGVEIHAAHGYLISQFLSPLTNRREDAWGGGLRPRARLLREVIDAVSAAVSPSFGIAVKLNSADFQRGGFEIDDAAEVIELIHDDVDFIELSGGSVESLATSGNPADRRTLDREAYFLNLAADLTQISRVPLMLTGGIRRGDVARSVIQRGFALSGVATALALRPDAPSAWLVGADAPVPPPRSFTRNTSLRAAAIQAHVTSHLHALGRHDGRALPPLLALGIDQLRRNRAARRLRRR